MILEGEQALPIYRFNAKWIEKSRKNIYSYRPEFTEGLPAGNIWNNISFLKMFREEQPTYVLNSIMKKFWDEYLNSEEAKERNIERLVSLEVKYFEHETWYLEFFQHATIDLGQSNEAVLLSFEKFVKRKEKLNRMSKLESNKEVYCLMGAEDRFRWHGGIKYEGDNEIYISAPCRCRYCKEQGLIRIVH